MNYGFLRVGATSLKLKVANPSYNKEEIKKVIDEAIENDVRLLVTPELSVTSYTAADLFFNDALINNANDALKDIVKYTFQKNIVVVVGMPVRYLNSIYNCAVVIKNGNILGVIPKTHIANYSEFYEKRWFSSGDDFKSVKEIELCGFKTKIGKQLFDLGNGAILGVEICEDLWVTIPPSSYMSLAGANIIANLSSSDEYVSKAEYRKSLISNQSARGINAYIYAGSSVYESTTDLVFSGYTAVCENGAMLGEGERFKRENVITISDVDIQKLNNLRQSNMSFKNDNFDYEIIDAKIENENNDLKYRYVDSAPFVPSNKEEIEARCKEILEIQSSGLAKRIEHVGSAGCVVGISGGLDSTLALLVSVEAMKKLDKSAKDIIGVTMPGFGTTDRTYDNAINLMKSLGVTIKEISIKDASLQHFKDIDHDESVKDITYENTQARERTQILFDIANKTNCLLVGTGDLSELALGWCTYNGDHMSMYGVNASVPKTLVRYLIDYQASVSDEKTKEILIDVLSTPVSPELLPPDENGEIEQKTEDKIGPYELHDFFLYNFVRFGFTKEKIFVLAKKAFQNKYDEKTIKKWLDTFVKRFFISQFKRSCIPDSPKVGSVSLSPRGDWRMPSDSSMTDFI